MLKKIIIAGVLICSMIVVSPLLAEPVLESESTGAGNAAVEDAGWSSGDTPVVLQGVMVVSER
jgi:hypothetical protein